MMDTIYGPRHKMLTCAITLPQILSTFVNRDNTIGKVLNPSNTIEKHINTHNRVEHIFLIQAIQLKQILNPSNNIENDPSS